jgi:integrase
MNALSASNILTQAEVLQVINYCRARRRRKNVRQNEIVFRLAAFCGLRCSEICKLSLGDITVDGPRPAILVPKRISKGRVRMRSVPLWWDQGNLEVLAAWLKQRKDAGAGPADPVVCTVNEGLWLSTGRALTAGKRIDRTMAARRWKAIIRCLGPGRVRQLSIHCGRHTFASHAIAAGRSIVEVQMALGHAGLSSTAVYAHLVERNNIPDLYSA